MMDNDGENKLLQQRCESKYWQFAMKYECICRDTPQHNHMVELGFATLGNKGRALMVRSNIPMNKRYLNQSKVDEVSTNVGGGGQEQ
jgi:hypothetical protein